MVKLIKARIQLSELVLTKVQLNLKSELSKSYLSFTWWVLEPMLHVAVLYVVFGLFLARGTPNFIAFLLCGQIPFLWLSRTVGNSSMAMYDGQVLMNQIKIPKLFFPLVTVFQDFFKTTLVFVMMVLFFLIYGIDPSVSWLSLPIIMFTQLLFVAWLSIVGAMVVPYIPDARFLITTGLQLLMFGSGIFYSYKEVLLPEHQGLFLLNPMANLIRIYREVLIEGLWPDWGALFKIAALFLVLLIVTVRILRRLESQYPRIVIQ